MEYVIKVYCPVCDYLNRIARYDEEECYKCGEDLHQAIQESRKV